MKKRVIYLAGPMRGYPDNNYPLFRGVTRILREFHDVYDPSEFEYDRDLPFPVREAFAEYAKFICREACTIVFLPGWEHSVGATAEHALGRNVGCDFLHWADPAHRRELGLQT